MSVSPKSSPLSPPSRGQAQAKQTKTDPRASGRSDESSAARHETRSGRNYMFVDTRASTKATREAVRVHVMRECHRLRRLFGCALSSRPTQDQLTIFGPTTPTGSTPQRRMTEQRLEPVRQPPSPIAPDDRLESIEIPPRSLEDLNDLANQCKYNHHIHQGAFAYNFSLSLSLQDCRTIDQTQEVLRLCRNDAAALSSCLALIAFQTPSFNARSAEIASAQLEAQALEVLRSRLAGPSTRHSDGTILAVALLSKLEASIFPVGSIWQFLSNVVLSSSSSQHCRNNHIAAEAHEVALRRLVGARGGISSIAAQGNQIAEALSKLGFGLTS